MKYNEIKNKLLASVRGTFGLTNLMKAGFSYKQGSDLLKLIHNDRDFILITFDSNLNSWRFTSFKQIIAPFVEINLRPLGTFTELITDEKIRGFIGMKLGLKSEVIDVIKIIAKLAFFGLVMQVNNKYSFPIHHLLKYLKRLKYSEETKLMTNFISAHIKTNQYKKIYSSIYTSTLSMLDTLKLKEKTIILLRYGIKNEKRLTLESIGNQLDITRERVRQIENIAFRKLRHPRRLNKIKSIYYMILIANKGCLFIPRNLPRIYLNTVAFVLDFLDISFFMREEGLIIGQEYLPNSCFDEEMLWEKEIDTKMIRETLNHIGFWWLGDEDLNWIFENVKRMFKKKQRKIHRTYIALKDLGQPSHYSDIAIRHNEIFPEYSTIERNIHAVLTVYPDHFVWTGKLGVYALPEWGYERPKMSLLETCYKIVSERYEDTGKPVEYSYVQSQMYKYRKVVNPNSIFFSCHFNEAINVTQDNKLIPADKTESVYIDTDEDYRKIEAKLEEFEKSLN